MQGVPARNPSAEVNAIFNYIQSNIRYTHDVEGMDTYRRARRTAQMKIGDCDDMAILAGALLQMIGYPVRLKVISVSGEGYEHIYLLVGVPVENPASWIPFDPSVSRSSVGWETDRIAYDEVFEL